MSTGKFQARPSSLHGKFQARPSSLHGKFQAQRAAQNNGSSFRLGLFWKFDPPRSILEVLRASARARTAWKFVPPRPKLEVRFASDRARAARRPKQWKFVLPKLEVRFASASARSAPPKKRKFYSASARASSVPPKNNGTSFRCGSRAARRQKKKWNFVLARAPGGLTTMELRSASVYNSAVEPLKFRQWANRELLFCNACNFLLIAFLAELQNS